MLLLTVHVLCLKYLRGVQAVRSWYRSPAIIVETWTPHWTCDQYITAPPIKPFPNKCSDVTRCIMLIIIIIIIMIPVLNPNSNMWAAVFKVFIWFIYPFFPGFWFPPDRRGECGPAGRPDRQFGWHRGCGGGKTLRFPRSGGGTQSRRGRWGESSSKRRRFQPVPGGWNRGPLFSKNT